MNFNRRSDLRVPVRCEVKLQPLADTSLIQEGQVQDISAGGMQILADRPYPVHSQVLLDFECKELGWGHLTSFLASVMWIDPHPTNGHCRLGVKFSDSSEL
ncbi:PilZ domain-containing protein [Thiocystis violascens]|uniref:Putative glycosyltransferase n=1 Tax=Thiocystis violascens (strain ATCC 17096 / DSM 198 / 6111) TaxID=765911 RepID=I3YC73_THIV6|nr:PilZ domain-containing protein [Thiocystis violascens]AFL74591.1 putative glycosyltransferase [Thiocystis violascens DSM 198]